MQIREATYSDMEPILQLYRQARAYFSSADIPQWLDGRPDYDDVFGDIDDGICYVAVENGYVLAVFICDFSEESRYGALFGGAWLNDDEYAGLHRVAVGAEQKGKGIGGEIVKFVANRCRENGVYNLRCDTHPKNAAMRRMLEKSGFVACGKFFERGEERVGYHLELSDQKVF